MALFFFGGFGAVVRGAIVAAAALFLAPVFPAAAQDQGAAWIQLEALPDLATAEERARSYGAQLGAAAAGQVAGFRLGTRWYLIALGPFSAPEAAGKLASLKAAGQIPRDAYVTDGTDHGAQFWPVGAAAAPLPAQTPEAAPTPEPAPAAELALAPEPAPTDETIAQAQASESALPRADKALLQQALQWYGHYTGALDGAFGRGTRAAMADWQAAMVFEPTGVLTSLQRATLVTNYRADEAAFGFTPVTEAEAGIEFSLPSALLAFDHYEPPFVHYVARDGSKLRLLLISEPGDANTLAGLYDLLQTLEAVPAGGERALQDNQFTINAASSSSAAFATARASKGAIKGYMLVWQPQQADMAQRILPVLATSFRSTGDQVLDPGLVPLDAAIKAGVLAGMTVKAPKSHASGVFVDDRGLVLTAASAVQGCGKITLDGALDAEILALDAAIGAAVLRPLTAAAPMAVARLAQSSSPLGAQALVAGYSLPTGLPAPVLTQAQIAALGGPGGEAGLMTLTARISQGDIGGPVMDQNGALIGIILGTDIGGKSLPQGTALALDAAALAPLLAQVGITAAALAAQTAPMTADAQNAAAMGATVQVACWP